MQDISLCFCSDYTHTQHTVNTEMAGDEISRFPCVEEGGGVIKAKELRILCVAAGTFMSRQATFFLYIYFHEEVWFPVCSAMFNCGVCT